MEDNQSEFKPLSSDAATHHSSGRPIIGYVIAGLFVLLIISGVAFAATSSSGGSNTTSTSAANLDPNATFKDGTYSAMGTYDSPGGMEQIKIEVTIKGNVITDTTATEAAKEDEGREYQQLFIDNYKPQVVGKKIATLSLGKISGSSLTPIGFNDALDQIRQQAKS